MLRNCFRLKAITWINQLIRFLRRIVKNTKRQYPSPSHNYNISDWSEWGREHLARGRSYLGQGHGNLVVGPAVLIGGNAPRLFASCEPPDKHWVHRCHRTIQSIQGMITF